MVVLGLFVGLNSSSIEHQCELKFTYNFTWTLLKSVGQLAGLWQPQVVLVKRQVQEKKKLDSTTSFGLLLYLGLRSTWNSLMIWWSSMLSLLVTTTLFGCSKQTNKRRKEEREKREKQVNCGFSVSFNSSSFFTKLASIEIEDLRLIIWLFLRPLVVVVFCRMINQCNVLSDSLSWRSTYL